MNKKVVFSGLLFSLFLFNACQKDANSVAYDCTGLTPTYTNDIKSIMDGSCAMAGCHSAAAKAGGYDLSSYSAVSAAGSNNAFMGSMEHQSGYDAMPQGASKLSTTNLQKIYCWIQSGKPQ